MQTNVMVCKNCKRLSTTVIRGLCAECVKELESKFPEVREYIYENQGATMNEVSEACGVPVKQIKEWVKEERLEIVSGDGSIVCGRCGKPIKTGRYCDKCKSDMSKALTGVQSINKEDDSYKRKDLGNKMRFLQK